VGLLASMALDSRELSAQTPPVDDATARGRNAYLRGVQLSRDQEWGAALASFEEAASARDAPLVEYNIAYCERALGRYVAARRTLQGLLVNAAGLDPAQIEDARGYLAESDKLVVRVAVHLDPADATLTIDGRPLAEGDGPDTYVAGMAPPGNAAQLGKPSFVVLLDPGAHLFRAAREGHEDAVLARTYRAGENTALDLRLDVLPATISLRSEPPAALVRVDSREVGIAPIEFQRAAGRYRLEVLLDGYTTYESAVDLAPGQRADLTARLRPYQAPLTKKWWFWTGAAAVVVGGALATYFATRPSPQPPPYDPGSANWLAHAQSWR